MTKSTPVPPLSPVPLRSPDTEPQPEGDDDADSERIRPAASQPPDPATHTDPPTPPTTPHSDDMQHLTDRLDRVALTANGIARLAVLTQRNAELAETCRVLTELAQQLVDAADAMGDPDCYGLAELSEAVAAAAELGITPKDQP